MYKFIYKINNSLPPLAWLADIDKKTDIVTVYVGSRVETEKDFFVAGVWDGDFSEADFGESEVFYGTGARLINGAIRFSTPSHALERLIRFENNDTITFSNSVPFLMAFCGLELDHGIDQYEKIYCSMLDGLTKYERNIPLKNGAVMKQYISANITVSTDGKISENRRPATAPFTDFEQYYSRIRAMLRAVRNNSEDQDRKKTSFGLVSTISSGYDSTACSALVKEIGCDTAASLCGSKYDIDNGERAARELGYTKIVKREQNSYKIKKGLIDAEYLCSGEEATMLQFSVFEDIFAGNLVFFGARGSYWDKASGITDELEMKGYFRYETDVSWTENALKNGYIPIPLPAYGADVCSSIRRISVSAEMAPWTLGGSYDKPIPRRIAETAGVSRDAFGMKKYGGGFSLCSDNMKRLSKKMSNEGYAAFAEFRKSGKGVKNTPARFVHILRYKAEILPTYINAAARIAHINISARQQPPAFADAGAPADLLFWGTEIMKKRYRSALDTDK